MDLIYFCRDLPLRWTEVGGCGAGTSCWCARGLPVNVHVSGGGLCVDDAACEEAGGGEGLCETGRKEKENSAPGPWLLPDGRFPYSHP